MLIAVDYNDKKVHIDETHSNQEYYCQSCGAPLSCRKGDIRQHHFAHKRNHRCSDSWIYSTTHGYDLSPWHNEWQSLFPKENQEVKLVLGDTRHRADVMIDRTVIEFQRSIMAVQAFDDRNNFYFNLSNKVIWLFDLSDLMESQLSYEETEEGLNFFWKNPKKAFNNYDVKSGCIDLFFQLKDGPEKCIVRVIDVSEYGFERFYTTNFMSKNDFLLYVGLKNGKCLPPCREDIENNEKYCSFKEKYHINLNKQQERALLAVEGSNLLLAVPGSGKTTVLVQRLGHMVINKNIPPETILAITYNTIAAEEMEERFSAQFGKKLGERIDFRTINSLSLKIYSDYCAKNGKSKREQIQDDERRNLLREIFKNYNGEYASENNVLELSAAITYIKNMMLTDEQICQLESEYPHLNEMYQSYQKALKDKNQMDFDDQMVFAYAILQNREEFACKFRLKYKYICIDEAQDTSKIQHEIIKNLAQGNNIFMVGDEDQSIYGFRAAYPKALLNFRYRYNNPYILRMERNYRSTNQIVDAARTFISKNKGRYEKNMTAERGDGENVSLEVVDSREMQYMRLLEIAQNCSTETAFLYRDNESAVVLVDLFLRNNISFRLRKPEMNFFGNRVVKDIVAYLSLALDEFDVTSFGRIYHKGLLYMDSQTKDDIIKDCKNKQISVYDAIKNRIPFLDEIKKNKSQKFRTIMNKVANSETFEAIGLLMDNGYEKYLRDSRLDSGKIEILLVLAKQEPNIKNFLNRLIELEKLIQKDFNSQESNAIILSTIHSSKGKEYDNVYMVDVYDGRFPSSIPNIFNRSKDNADGEQEERRLFYVGITRAKNKLCLFDIKDRETSFIDQIFYEEKRMNEKAKKDEFINARDQQEQRRAEIKRRREEEELIIWEQEKFIQEEIRKSSAKVNEESTSVSNGKSTETDEHLPREKSVSKAKYNFEYDKLDKPNRYGYNPYNSSYMNSDSSYVLSEKNASMRKDDPLNDTGLFSSSRAIRCKLCGRVGTINDFWTYCGTEGECYSCKK